MKTLRTTFFMLLMACGLINQSASAFFEGSVWKVITGSVLLGGVYSGVRFFEEYNKVRSIENFWLRDVSRTRTDHVFSSYTLKSNIHPVFKRSEVTHPLQLTLTQVQALALNPILLQAKIGQRLDDDQGVIITEGQALLIISQLQEDIAELSKFKICWNSRLIDVLQKYENSLNEVLQANAAGINLAEQKKLKQKIYHLQRENNLFWTLLNKAYVFRSVEDQKQLEQWLAELRKPVIGTN